MATAASKEEILADPRPYVYCYQTRSKRWAFTALNNQEYKQNNICLQRLGEGGRYALCRNANGRAWVHVTMELAASGEDPMRGIHLYRLLDTKHNNKVVLVVFKPWDDGTTLEVHPGDSDKVLSKVDATSPQAYKDILQACFDFLGGDKALLGEPTQHFSLLSEPSMDL